MTTIGQKVAYVKSQGQTRKHHCHWPGCDKQVPPAMWGCKPHWYALPQAHRDAIWAAYQPGQERTGLPSPTYADAADAAQAWIKQHLQKQRDAQRQAKGQGTLL